MKMLPYLLVFVFERNTKISNFFIAELATSLETLSAKPCKLKKAFWRPTHFKIYIWVLAENKMAANVKAASLKEEISKKCSACTFLKLFVEDIFM